MTRREPIIGLAGVILGLCAGILILRQTMLSNLEEENRSLRQVNTLQQKELSEIKAALGSVLTVCC